MTYQNMQYAEGKDDDGGGGGGQMDGRVVDRWVYREMSGGEKCVMSLCLNHFASVCLVKP